MLPSVRCNQETFNSRPSEVTIHIQGFVAFYNQNECHSRAAHKSSQCEYRQFLHERVFSYRSSPISSTGSVRSPSAHQPENSSSTSTQAQRISGFHQVNAIPHVVRWCRSSFLLCLDTTIIAVCTLENKTKYDASISTTSRFNGAKFRAVYGDGSYALGVFVNDTVTVRPTVLICCGLITICIR